MKRVRLERLSSQLLAAPPARTISASRFASRAPRASTSSPRLRTTACLQIRCQSTTVSPDLIYEDEFIQEDPEEVDPRTLPLPSPPPSRAQYSAKLAALHARLSLSPRLPLETLARALIDPSADSNTKFNNTNLAYLGASLLQYHTSEFLVTRYPRLPLAITFAAMKGYAGPEVLQRVARAWGVEAAAAPGEEVDPGYLQFDPLRPTVEMKKGGYVRAESAEIARFKWRRGMSSRVTYDNAFGEMVPGQASVSNMHMAAVSNEHNEREKILRDAAQNAHANFVRAVVGAIYLHCGRENAKSFVKSHFLSRTLDLSNLFEFKVPTRELARLCAREDFEAPVARLESETGRMSRTPVFVVGIYSGKDKLGEGAGSSLDEARVIAAQNALKSWYLYSPGEVALPSDTFAEDAAPWKPVYIDIGEIIS
ncbi:ribonuclease III domain-containing protein [Pseudomassariella vexata]|uniref:Large ribosomal subunit protein mL44 n=1 Tax=Pseudomassariella vexata TaxID=1141098 RepID=A0A1Y2E053_9PEZI|nr:ribonuclease III domain-containing protein [Pseudomassariella vexata]ORY64918.1 ribonuclease III domain-containing protein [Pseudomassariella vexata]